MVSGTLLTGTLLKNDSINNTLWVVRSAGERTTELCEQLIRQFAPAENVRVIHERPFGAAVRKGFELGAASGLKWTCCIDADVLLLEKEMKKQWRIAETLGDDVFCVQGLVYGKFLPIKRPAGNHLYRNALVEQAIPLIPSDGHALRPESVTTQAMKEQGCLTYQTNVVLGLHDYEQHYLDIYRKCFLHVNKHEEDLMPMVESHWRKHQAADRDYQVALLGALMGKVHEGTVYIDKHFQEEEGQRALALKNIPEKPPLSLSDYPPETIRAIARRFRPVKSVQQYKNPRYRENYVRDTPAVVRFSPLKNVAGSLFLIVGKILSRVGRRLVRWGRKI